MAAGLFDLADKNLIGDELLGRDILEQAILEPAGKAEHRFGQYAFICFDPFRRAVPADFDAAKEIGFCFGHLEEARRFKAGALAENFLVGLETHRRAAAVLHFFPLFKWHLGMAALKNLPIKNLA